MLLSGVFFSHYLLTRSNQSGRASWSATPLSLLPTPRNAPLRAPTTTSVFITRRRLLELRLSPTRCSSARTRRASSWTLLRSSSPLSLSASSRTKDFLFLLSLLSLVTLSSSSLFYAISCLLASFFRGGKGSCLSAPRGSKWGGMFRSIFLLSHFHIIINANSFVLLD